MRQEDSSGHISKDNREGIMLIMVEERGARLEAIYRREVIMI